MRRAALVLVLLLLAPSTASAATKVSFEIAPAVPRYGTEATFSGVVTSNGAPAAAEDVHLMLDDGSGFQDLGTMPTGPDGRYAFAMGAVTPGSYWAALEDGTSSAAVVLTIRPLLEARVRGLPYPGSPLYLRGRLTPAIAGKLRLRVGARRWSVQVGPRGGFRAPLPTRRIGWRTATLKLNPASGYVEVRRQRDYRIKAPYLTVGSRGEAVLALERRLRVLRYTPRQVNSFFGVDTYESVLAFEKVHRMSRNGRVSRAVWRKLGRAHVPHARFASGTHIEVDKTRQVLFEVRRGKVVRVIHVSTGATGNTPIGRWHVYLKTPGLNASGMYYSMFFTGAFAIHGYHSVPPWPASHGCVRIPMWQAPPLFSRWPLGTTVYIYYSP